MIPTLSQALRLLGSRILLLWNHGVLVHVDDAPSRQKVDIQLLKDETDQGLEHHQPYGFTSHPVAGADVIALYQGGNRDHGIVIMIEDRRYRLVNLGLGDVALYDDKQQYVKLTTDGVYVVSQKHVEVNAVEDIKVKDGYGQEILMEPTGITIKAVSLDIQKPDGAGPSPAVNINVDTAVINCTTKAIVNTPAMELGGEGGSAVARIGDDVDLGTGKIITGSSIVRAT